ncbi:MAG: DUF3089 domain-containing protein [Lachnospiraceae bacterium]|nr:DUF3089 domain-containing protein [Lachnospiraceae bacterium]
MKKSKHIICSSFLIIILGIAVGCAKPKANPLNKDVSIGQIEQDKGNFYDDRILTEDISKVKGIEKLKEKVDYSNPDNWLVIPRNPSKVADVIYIYPTVYGKSSKTQDDVADIDDASMRVSAQKCAAAQASVFGEKCNIYAPYYRQFTVDSLLDLMDNNPEALYYIAAQDLYPMLDYYFENCNEGRPFLLAGHSQGSVWLTVILEDYMKEHPEYLKNMVASYVIGYSVTKEYLAKNAHLKFAQKADDTGVIISYNVEGPGNKDAYNCVVKEDAISINPINWKLDETYATEEENLGSMGSNGQIINNYADARVDTQRGVVVCDSVKISPEMQQALSKYFGPESFHTQEYSLYYMNLRQNVEDRIQAFISKN